MLQNLKPNLLVWDRLQLFAGIFLGLAGITLCLIAVSVPAEAGTSPTYQVRDDQVGGTHLRQSSNTYTVDGTVEAIVGSGTSTLYQGQLGAPVRIDAASNGGGSGSSGGGLPLPTGCVAPANLTVTNIQCNRIYKNLIKLTGTKDKNTTFVYINDDLSGVHFGSTTTWDKDVLLKRGQNTLLIVGKNFCDAQTPPITVVLNLVRMGDTNDDNQTNDYDLSTFTRRWESKKDCLSDFNRDLITNDYDLSLLASSWSG